MRAVAWLSRIYSAMLYAYPPSFRHAFGEDMQQVFRERCREVARKPGHLHLLRFSAATAADWAATTVREGFDAVRMPKLRGPITEWALTVIMYLFVTTTLVQAYVVPTGSMETNLKVGDHMLVERIDRNMHRGDMVAFVYPVDVRQTFVKRVIGLPGDRIGMVDKQVVRNGEKLVEPYTRHIFPGYDPSRDDFAELVVPPDSLFVMGDNRDNSLDSRYWGFVPQRNVVGKPLIVYWSFDAPTEDFEQWSLAHTFDIAAHFFTRTRWDRMFLIPR